MRKYILTIKKYLLLELLFDAVATALFAFTPVLQQQLFDSIIAERYGRIPVIIVTYTLLLAGNILAGYFCMIFTWKGAVQFETDMKKDFFRAVFKLSKKQFYQKPIGEYISMQGNDVAALEQDYLQPIVDVVRSINMCIIYAAVLFIWVDWRIAIIIILTSFLSIWGPKLTGRLLTEKRTDFQKQLAQYVVKITDLLEGITAINSRTRKKIDQNHEESLLATAKSRYGYGKAKSMSLAVNDLTMKIIHIAAFTVIGILFYRHEITLGIGVAAFGYVSSFVDPIDSILYDINAIQSVSKVKKNVLQYIDNPIETEHEIPMGFQKTITINDMQYRNGDFGLFDLNYSFKKGQKYAIIGASGAGKSTFLKLLMGYATPEQGSILIDGHDVRKVDTSAMISYTAQNEHIFKTGFWNNATMFESYSPNIIQKLMNQMRLNIFDVISGKNGEDDCQLLSGGEKQCLAFLRALTQNTDILLMDEPFSAVDAITKEKMEKYLFQSDFFSEKTLIMVTHDTSENFLHYFDTVLVMENGYLCEKEKPY